MIITIQLGLTFGNTYLYNNIKVIIILKVKILHEEDNELYII
jgi:hypothetical protein